MLALSRYQSLFEKLTCGFLCVALLGMSVSASLITVGLILAAFSSLLSGSYRNILPLIKHNSFFYALFILWLLLFIGVFNNHFIPNYGWHHLKKYMGVWLLGLIIMPVFMKEQYRHFIFSMIVILSVLTSIFIFSCHHFNIVALFGKTVMAMIINPIPWSYCLAFSAFILVQYMMHEKKHPVIGSIFLFWLLYSLYFLNVERSGMLAGLILIVVFSFQHFPKKYGVLVILSVVVVATGLFFISPAVHNRVAAMLMDIKLYFQGNPVTSIGLRLAFAKYSWILIKQKPLFGYGTGAFSMAYHTVGGPGLPGVTYLGDPHNSFIHLWVQCGLFGLLAFVVFLIWQFIKSFDLPVFERHIAQGLVISFSIFCACISAFLRQRAVVFYLIVLVISFAANKLHAAKIRSDNRLK